MCRPNRIFIPYVGTATTKANILSYNYKSAVTPRSRSSYQIALFHVYGFVLGALLVEEPSDYLNTQGPSFEEQVNSNKVLEGKK